MKRTGLRPPLIARYVSRTRELEVKSTLDIVWRNRSGGGGRTERRYLDLAIDGVPLSSLSGADFISPLGWVTVEEQNATIDRWLRQRSPELAGGRTALCVCPECAALGCGAVTAVLEGGPGVIVWRDFGIQNNYEDAVHREGFETIGPFTFDGSLYRLLLEAVRSELRGSGG